MIKKIGFSASRCIADIVAGKVNIYNVVLLTTSTDCPTIEHWLRVIEAYHSIPNYDDRSLADYKLEDCLKVAKELWYSGKVHQPRVYGGVRMKSPYVWMDLVHTNEDREANPALAKAWEHAQMIGGLVSTVPDTGGFDAYDEAISEIAQLSAEITDDMYESKPNK